MQNYNNINQSNQKPKIPASVMVICIIELVIRAFGLLFLPVILIFHDLFISLMRNPLYNITYSRQSIIINIIITLIVLIGSIIILNRKKIGVAMYFAGYAIGLLFSVINLIRYMTYMSDFYSQDLTIPFIIGTIVGFAFVLILPILMAVFVRMNKESFS